MRWFKHLSGALKDPMITDLVAEFGGDGYLVFFGLMELMAEDFDAGQPGVFHFSVTYLTKNLQISARKMIKVLDFLAEFPRKDGDYSKILYARDGDKITLKCQRLKDLADEWTGRQIKKDSGVTSEVLGSHSNPKTPDIDIEKGVNTLKFPEGGCHAADAEDEAPEPPARRPVPRPLLGTPPVEDITAMLARGGFSGRRRDGPRQRSRMAWAMVRAGLGVDDVRQAYRHAATQAGQGAIDSVAKIEAWMKEHNQPADAAVVDAINGYVRGTLEGMIAAATAAKAKA